MMTAALSLNHWINGEQVASDRPAESLNPSDTREVVAHTPQGGVAEVDAAVAAAKAALDANQHHYTGPTGLPPLRAAIAKDLKENYGLDYTADEIVVTAGVQESIMLCMLALVAPGDEVLITSPRFTTYDTAVHLCGGVPVPVPTVEANDFALSVADIEARITPRTRMFVMVSPNNPTGAVTPPAVIRQIADLAIKHDILIIADEIYAKMIYAPNEHLSIATLSGMKGRTITLNGFSKTYAMTGWRLGWMAGPLDAMKAAGNLQSHLSSNVSNISQKAALAALTGPQDEVLAMREAFDRRRKLAVAELNKISGWHAPMPEGAFYVYSDVTGLLGREWGGKQINTSLELCDYILDAAEVALVPGEAFGPSGYVRLSYALGDGPLLEGIQRLQKLFG